MQNEFNKIFLLSEEYIDNSGNKTRQRKIDQQIANMIQALVKVNEKSILMSNLSLYSHPGFIKKCKKAQ